MKNYNNILLISSSGRKVGKTTFVCEIINKFTDQHITAIKISPHFHEIKNSENLIFRSEKFEILEEKNTDGLKDSSKMLTSGAEKVFYIQAVDENIYHAFKYLHENFIFDKLVICESAALGKFIKPAYHFIVTNNSQTSEKKQFADIHNPIFIQNINNNFQFNFEKLKLIDNKWVLF